MHQPISQVDILDPKNILTKTQKNKIRQFVLNCDYPLEKNNQKILESVHYPDLVEPYTHVNCSQEKKRFLLEFSHSPFQENDKILEENNPIPVSLQIDIKDPENKISKTQKRKLRQWIALHWKGEEAFYDQLDSVLELIVYSEGIKPYNRLSFDLDRENLLVLHFSRIEEETLEEKRKALKQKIQAKYSKQTKNDPTWKAYYQLKSKLPHVAEKFLPNPDQVMANLEMYRAMMQNIPSHHPVHQYLKLLIV